MNTPKNLTQTLTRISQNHLNLLATCPRKFQHTYLEQLRTPISLEQQTRSNWGSQFHLLMQQRELGLPIDSFLAEEDELKHSLTALINTAPELFEINPNLQRDAEHLRTLNFNNYLLTVIYDLLITQSHKAQIIDWKTYLMPEDRKRVANSWQTRLYLYVLAETSSYLPEEISMTYWFVKLPNQPQSLTINYNAQQHEKNRTDLTHLLSQLSEWLEAYIHSGLPFPQVNETSIYCPYCSFVTRCQRSENTETISSLNWQNATSSGVISEIEEVPI